MPTSISSGDQSMPDAPSGQPENETLYEEEEEADSEEERRMEEQKAIRDDHKFQIVCYPLSFVMIPLLQSFVGVLMFEPVISYVFVF
jgi:hypothetical protein